VVVRDVDVLLSLGCCGVMVRACVEWGGVFIVLAGGFLLDTSNLCLPARPSLQYDVDVSSFGDDCPTRTPLQYLHWGDSLRCCAFHFEPGVEPIDNDDSVVLDGTMECVEMNIVVQQLPPCDQRENQMLPKHMKTSRGCLNNHLKIKVRSSEKGCARRKGKNMTRVGFEPTP
jgi:hypothetical protein